MTNQHFKIIMTCRNAEKWIARSVQSVLNQNYTNWQAVVVDALSEDHTYKILLNSLDQVDSEKFIIIANLEIETAIVNNFKAIQAVCPEDEDVLVFLDGDDWFYDSHTLEHLNEAYSDPDVWITWGNYILHPYRKHRGDLPIPANYELRKERWITSHLKTCKYFLWRNIKDEDFRNTNTGKYYTTSRDVAFMFPMLEMAGPKHRKFIDKTLYVYNSVNPTSDRLIHNHERRITVRDIRNRPPYAERTKEQLLLKGVG